MGCGEISVIFAREWMSSKVPTFNSLVKGIRLDVHGELRLVTYQGACLVEKVARSTVIVDEHAWISESNTWSYERHLSEATPGFTVNHVTNAGSSAQGTDHHHNFKKSWYTPPGRCQFNTYI